MILDENIIGEIIYMPHPDHYPLGSSQLLSSFDSLVKEINRVIFEQRLRESMKGFPSVCEQLQSRLDEYDLIINPSGYRSGSMDALYSLLQSYTRYMDSYHVDNLQSISHDDLVKFCGNIWVFLKELDKNFPHTEQYLGIASGHTMDTEHGEYHIHIQLLPKYRPVQYTEDQDWGGHLVKVETRINTCPIDFDSMVDFVNGYEFADNVEIKTTKFQKSIYIKWSI